MIAGLFAAVSAVVLGNLDQIRRLIWGIAEIGHGSGQWETTAKVMHCTSCQARWQIDDGIYDFKAPLD